MPSIKVGVTDQSDLIFSFKEASMPRKSAGALRRISIATMSAILFANLALLGTVAAPASAATEVYGYSCCAGGFGTTAYHPGQVIKVDWIRTAGHSSHATSKTVVLSLNASGPFPSIANLKKAMTKTPPSYGPTSFAAAPIHLSDQKAAHPISILRIPATAKAGFYELTIMVVKGHSTSSSVGIFTIKS
jgi:hypothetical protein